MLIRKNLYTKLATSLPKKDPPSRYLSGDQDLLRFTDKERDIFPARIPGLFGEKFSSYPILYPILRFFNHHDPMKLITTNFRLLAYVVLFPLCLWGGKSSGQTYKDYFGNGHQIGLSTSSSDPGSQDKAEHSVSGTGKLPDLKGASRFLAQATLGYNYEDIESLSQIGIDTWLEEQFAQPNTSYLSTYFEQLGVSDLTEVVELQDLKNNRLSQIFYFNVLRGNDKLRQKMGFALSQILVTSISTGGNWGDQYAEYYDILYQNAFGNYRDLLGKVTYSTSMGRYLSSIKNPKADYGLNTLPDENYAREVMQLFTIGLLELNNNGTLKLDGEGNTIPTYTNDDIEELAKVFTGLNYATERSGAPNNNWNIGYSNYGRINGMKVFAGYHDVTPKKMIDGTVLPGGRNGNQDIEDALDLLFNHPNTGPFISIRLIQNFVKSNPTPAYVNRVAKVFNNNGQGVRGDLQAVLMAILTDPEARDCVWIDDPQNGKLAQPIERTTRLFAAFDIYTTPDTFYLRDQDFTSLGQRFMNAPTVFNYFSPFYKEEKYVAPADLVSPEFEILNDVTSIENLNLSENRAKNRPFRNRYPNGDNPQLELTDEINLMESQGIVALMDRLDILLCRGQLSDQTRNTIISTIEQYQSNINNYSDERAVRDAIYFLTVSADYLIIK